MAQTLPLRCCLILGLLVPGAASAQGVRYTDLFDKLALGAGETACEIGAGEGQMTLAAAERVGARGHVYTSELGDDRVKTLREKVDGRPHIHVIPSAEDHTNFPDSWCDAIFMRNVYHHFADPAAMNASIARALRPGGRLGVLDFRPPAKEAPRPEDRDEDGMHGVTSASVERELKAAGFSVIATEASPTGPDRWILVVASKPES